MPSTAKIIFLLLACHAPLGVFAQSLRDAPLPPSTSVSSWPDSEKLSPNFPTERASSGQSFSGARRIVTEDRTSGGPLDSQISYEYRASVSHPDTATYAEIDKTSDATEETGQEGPQAEGLSSSDDSEVAPETAWPSISRSGTPSTLKQSDRNTKPKKSADNLSTLLTMGSSLAIVLGLFFLFIWIMRRASPGGTTILPKEVVEVLGRTSLVGRQQVHLIRFGKKLLLVSITPTGMETLSEVDDSEEVNYIAGLCQSTRSGSNTQSFQQVFEELSLEEKLAQEVALAKSTPNVSVAKKDSLNALGRTWGGTGDAR